MCVVHFTSFNKTGNCYCNVFGTWQKLCKGRAGCNRMHTRRSIRALEGSCLKTSNANFARLSFFLFLVCPRNFVRQVRCLDVLSMPQGHQIARSGNGTSGACLICVFLGSHTCHISIYSCNPLRHVRHAHHYAHFGFRAPPSMSDCSRLRGCKLSFRPNNLLRTLCES